MSNLFTAQFQWSKIDAIESKGLKTIPTEQNVSVNYSINLPKNVINQENQNEDKYYQKIDSRKSLTTIRELRASECSRME